MPTPCSLLVDPPADGAWNMAVDEALINAVAASGQAVLRFYQWSEPTLSLGYFQTAADRRRHAASQSAAVVRRLSGGGALLHDCELTYAVVLPACHPLARDAPELYRAVHGALRSALADGAVVADFHGRQRPLPADAADAADGPEPFLCFARRTEFDLTVKLPKNAPSPQPGAKVAGSAQRRTRGVLLQHGAALVGASSAAPELLGVREAFPSDLTPCELIDPWAHHLAVALNFDFRPQKLAEICDLAVVRALREKYLSPAWTNRR